MTNIDKLVKKFLVSPDSLRYEEIKKILISLGFIEKKGRGSHKKFKHPNLKRPFIISVHGKDCKDSAKRATLKELCRCNFFEQNEIK